MTRPAMIFAAGKGTRMMPLTEDKPKCLVEVAGKPLLNHAVDLIPEGRHIVVNGHHFADQVRAALPRDRIAFSAEPTLLETGGGLKNAAPLLHAPSVLTLNADAVWSDRMAVTQLEEKWDTNMGALLLLVPTERAIGHKGGGDFSLDANGRLSRGGDHVYTGLQIIQRAPVNAWPEKVFSLNKIWDTLSQDGRLFGCVYKGYWADVGYPEAIAKGETMLAEHAV